VYYEVLNRLKVDLTEYCILAAMIYKSDENQFTENKSYLWKTLKIDRGTLNNRLGPLIKRGFIRYEGKNRFSLDIDLMENFRPENISQDDEKTYAIIFHKHREELSFSFARYALMYMMYSISKDYKSREVFASHEFYKIRIGIKIDQLNKDKAALIKKGILTPVSKGRFHFESEFYNMLEQRRKVMKNSRIKSSDEE
jgi:hypothetical protein